MDIRGLTLTALRRNIGVVFQEALLFNRSIAENLRVGKPDATEAEMREAAERAQALEFIERGDQKFDTNVGERGRMLSGGERQRLSIARALLKDPPILILDEATSALDAVTEAKVNAALDEVMRGRTTFVIAHRLSTIRNATRILVFQNGRVIESGTFDELVARGGHFAELARAQFMVQEQALSEASLAAASGRGTQQVDALRPKFDRFRTQLRGDSRNSELPGWNSFARMGYRFAVKPVRSARPTRLFQRPIFRRLDPQGIRLQDRQPDRALRDSIASLFVASLSAFAAIVSAVMLIDCAGRPRRGDDRRRRRIRTRAAIRRTRPIRGTPPPSPS